MMCFFKFGKCMCAQATGLVLLLTLLIACAENGERETGSGDIKSATLRLDNGSFDDGLTGWWGTENVMDSMTAETGELCVTVPGGLANPWDAIVGQSNLVLSEGASYDFSFTVRASESASLRAVVQEPADPYFEFVNISPTVGTGPTSFQASFVMGAAEQVPQAAFQIGGAASDVTFCFDDVSLDLRVRENVTNGSFDDGMNNWWTDAYLTDWDVASGAFCAAVPPTVETWEGLLGQNSIDVEAGVSYTLSFFAAGDSQQIIAVVQNAVDYTPIATLTVTPTAEGEIYSASFTAAESVPYAQLVFQLGGADATRNVCIDDVSLTGGDPSPYEPETGPGVRVNQTAYLPFGPKLATLVTDADAPLSFAVLDSSGASVFIGETVPFGTDVSSQLNVHTIDFSAFTIEGEAYTIVADGETSYPFAVGEDAYETLRVDALSMYYPQRSGVPIDGAVAGAEYARPAGHASSPQEGEVNLGDVDVPCQPAEDSALYYGEPWTCDYTLDVSGGWYDAGDQGKYVVNGGISVFQLLNLFERTKTAPSSDLGALGDGSLRIPEVGNGIPDVLDEVRFELEFFLKMMVPEGKPLAGMAHHKVHDNQWTGLPMMPHADPNPRWLHRPSTAATLNLAAAAAQGARIFAPYDAAFSDKLLTAARTAWAAALANPELFAPAEDGADGGGAYQDNYVQDEFYWAAAELYLTTGEGEFLDYVLGSEMHTADVFVPAGIIWYNVAALARMDLATVPSALPDRDAVIASVIQGAERYLNDQSSNGFGQPYNPPGGVYVWGSNSQVLNNLTVLATAYDLTGDERFRRGVLQGFDYIFGRNALNNSYVTAYGTVFSTNLHSRWYAHPLDESMPVPPPGTMAGGPNSEGSSWDPVLASLYPQQDCAPQFCYVDAVGSWSTNELTINWNAALAWVASFIADQDAANTDASDVCEVSFQMLYQCPHSDVFHALVRVTNTSDKPYYKWELAWSFFGDQSVSRASGADVEQAGAMITLTPKPRKRLNPGASRNILLKGNLGDLATTVPGTFFLNGKACRTK